MFYLELKTLFDHHLEHEEPRMMEKYLILNIVLIYLSQMKNKTTSETCEMKMMYLILRYYSL